MHTILGENNSEIVSHDTETSPCGCVICRKCNRIIVACTFQYHREIMENEARNANR